MLNLSFEKENEERLIFRDLLITKNVNSTALQNIDDFELTRKLSSDKRTSFEMRPNSTAGIRLQSVDNVRRSFDVNINSNKKQLEKYPNNPFLLNNLGLAYLGKGDFESAHKYLENAIQIKPDLTVSILSLAAIYIKQGDPEKASAMYERILEKNPNDTRALINLGELSLKKSDFNRAEQYFSKASELAPNDPTSINQLALIDLSKGQINSAISKLRDCLKISPNSTHIYNNIGIAYAAQKSFLKSIEAFKTSLQLLPKNNSALGNYAITLGQIGRGADAIDLMEEYLAKYESDYVRELLATFYANGSLYKKALKHLILVLNSAINKDMRIQKVARLRNNVGAIYHKLGDYENARLNYLLSMQEANSARLVTIGNMIDLLFDFHRYEDTIPYIELIKQNHADSRAHLYYQARYEYLNNHIDTAVELFELYRVGGAKVIALYPVLSFIYAEHYDNYPKAIEIAKEGLALFPQNTGLINNLAYYNLMIDSIDDARSILEMAKGVNNHLFLIATRGLLALKEGDIKKASELYNYASEMSASPKLKKEVIKKKYIEFSKFYFKRGNLNETRKYLRKVIETPGPNTIYNEQATQMYSDWFKNP